MGSAFYVHNDKTFHLDHSDASKYSEPDYEAPKSRITILDGFRALAILSVIAFHYTITFTRPNDPQGHIPATSPFIGFIPFEYGWIGVEFFFIISGFVILLTLNKCSGMLDFAKRRVARIWPALIVAAALTSLVTWLNGPDDWKVTPIDFLTSIFLIDPKFMALISPSTLVKWVDPVYWSLAVEIRFYFMAAIIFSFAKERFIIYWIVFQSCVAAGSIFASYFPITLYSIWSMVTIYKYLAYFTFGISIYELWEETSYPRWAVFGIVLSSLIIFLNAGLSAGVFADYQRIPSLCANFIMLSLFIIFLYRSTMLHWLSWSPIVKVGQVSYSLYLLHSCIGVSIIRILVLNRIPYIAAALMVLLGSIALALAFYRYVELPGKRLVMGAVLIRKVSI